MLVIHIGSPKTGTTAIQGFLKSHRAALRQRDISYVAAGRTNIAHNSMVQPLLKDRAEDLIEALRDELRSERPLTQVMSSELFFQPAIAAPLARAVGDTEVRVVCYLRRPDSFAEAMYKQKVKNGRIPPDPERFLETWGRNLRYMPVLAAYADAFGAGALCIRPFTRRHFPEGDVISDFATVAGGLDFGGLTRTGTPSNKTLSRAISEHLGRVNRNTPFNTRIMIREIAALDLPGTQRSGDVYDFATRQTILDDCAEDLDAVASQFFPDLDDPFGAADIADTYPDPQESVDLERIAADAVIAAIGRQAAKVAPV